MMVYDDAESACVVLLAWLRYYTEWASASHMKTNPLKIFTVLVAGSGIAGFVPVLHADGADAKERSSSLGAHVHGVSELTLAMEGPTLEIEFSSPAMNLVGFEHKANTKEDKAAVEKAALLLQQFGTLFSFLGARCEHIDTTLDLGHLVLSEDHGQLHYKSSVEQRHENEHGHEKDGHDQHSTHSEIVVNYRYRCDGDNQLSTISVALFETFPGIHKIHASWITPAGQGANVLTPANQKIKFR